MKRTSYEVGKYLQLPHILRNRLVRLIAHEKQGKQANYYVVLPRPQSFLADEEKEYIEELAAQFNFTEEAVEVA